MEFKEAGNQIEKPKTILSQEDLAVMMAEEENRLGVNSPEFIERHNEIMGLIEQAKNRNSGRNRNPTNEAYRRKIERLIWQTENTHILQCIYTVANTHLRIEREGRKTE